jgi:hypothetical protein
MKLSQDSIATAARGIRTKRRVVALARYAIGRLKLALARATRPAPIALRTCGAARRTGAPPFADTEAGWHHL